MAEKYLANAEEQARNPSQPGSLGEKDIQNGVTAVINLLQSMKAFTETPGIIRITAYEKERKATASLIAAPAFEPALRESLKGKLSLHGGSRL